MKQVLVAVALFAIAVPAFAAQSSAAQSQAGHQPASAQQAQAAPAWSTDECKQALADCKNDQCRKDIQAAHAECRISN